MYITYKTDLEELTERRSYVSKNTNSIINQIPEMVFISTFPPKVCGIATYTQDLTKILNTKFNKSFKTTICPIESESEHFNYGEKVHYKLNPTSFNSYINLTHELNKNKNIEFVMLEHEFGLFNATKNGLSFFLLNLEKDLIVTFHTVLPKPDYYLKKQVQEIANYSKSLIVMTDISAQILFVDYGISLDKIAVIPHGTHLLPFTDKIKLKEKYSLKGKKVLSTFGLLGPGKNIETSLLALPEIIKKNPDVMFLILGETHPTIVKKEGEIYRETLEEIVEKLHLEANVRFVNSYLPLNILLEYLQLTDVYLFTSTDRNQAVSGTFSYAIACGCPIVSTPIPHALEVLNEQTGIIIDFESPKQLAKAVNKVLANDDMKEKLSRNALEKMAPTAWENSAILHLLLFQKFGNDRIKLKYTLPEINLNHFENMTTNFGMIQFSKISKPDLHSGYTIDDNARAMIAICKHFAQYRDQKDLELISIYLNFIEFCQQSDGSFLNYVNEDKEFTDQNYTTNLEDSNGRAVWALGYLISEKNILPEKFGKQAEEILQKTLPILPKIHSTRAMAFIIKGLHYQNSKENKPLINIFATRLEKMFLHEQDADWHWFESYLTYGNSVLPEAMLCAWISTGNSNYKNIAKKSFKFLLSKIYVKNSIRVISNEKWLHKNDVHVKTIGGEQPIDIAYTVLALCKFSRFFEDENYREMMKNTFNWFLGKNHLHQIIYNPATGGCYDGLEEKNVNLNQGAESMVSYLMARLCF
jgi:glycosyltransferase involved in cell wall biosynthesis